MNKPTKPPRLAAAVDAVESFFSALFGTVSAIGLTFIAVAILCGLTDEGESAAWLFKPLAVVVLLMEPRWAYWTWSCFRKKLFPLGLTVALRQPRYWLIFRPAPLLWWTVRFICGLAGIVTIHIGDSESAATQWSSRYVVPVILTLAWNHLTYGYLMLAVDTFITDKTKLLALWDWRWRFDLVSTLAILIVKAVA